jgi:hypothetical protein
MVLIVTVELPGPLVRVTVAGNSEHEAYSVVCNGLHVSATLPPNPPEGVASSPYVAKPPLTTCTDALAPPLTVNVNDALATPVPVKGTAAGELGSELTIDSAALRAPADDGENASVTVQLAPGTSGACGQGTVTAKSPAAVPLTLSASPVTGAVPLLASTSERFAVEPSAMLPNARLEGVTVSFDCVPIPISGTVSGLLEADVLRASVPVNAPTVVGANVTSIVQLACGARFPTPVGQLPPAEKSPLAVTLAKATVTVPVFVTVTGNTAVAPTCTEPKFTAPGASVKGEG